MNLYDDESLKQEVIYLHSLWHQGPPNRNPVHTPNYYPIQRSQQSNYIPPADFQLLSRYGAINKRPRSDTGREWPVNEIQQCTPTASGWPEFKPSKKARPVPVDEIASFAISKLQRDIHRTCREFFGGNGNSDSDEEDEEDEEEENSEKEGSYLQFLTKLFEVNEELKEYYKKNSESGEFWCLVCGGTGEKSCRKFKSCLALIQHSLAIYKTELKKQHRAFAQVVCNVLGWDVNNPVASSQKDPQAVVECTSELPLASNSPQVISVDEEAKAAALLMQQTASEALKDMCGKDDDETEENGDEDLKIISKVFLENDELKSYYLKSCEGGSFICLVCCAATDKKMIKRFKHCYALIQHCTKRVPKTNIRAHKGFARFVSELLGWDFDCLPRRVVKGDAPLVESSDNQNSEKSESVTEDDICEEDKVDNPKANTGEQ